MKADADTNKLTEAVIAAARSQVPGIIIRLATDDPNAPIGFGAKVSLDGPVSPGFSGFVASRAFDSLKALTGASEQSGGKECVILVEREGLLRRGISQFVFAQSCSEIILCTIGDDSCRCIIEAVIDATKEWREGMHRLFDGDGYIRDDIRDIAVKVNAPSASHSNFWHWVEVAGALISLIYALSHWYIK